MPRRNVRVPETTVYREKRYKLYSNYSSMTNARKDASALEKSGYYKTVIRDISPRGILQYYLYTRKIK